MTRLAAALTSQVSPTQHVSVVNDLNAILASAHDPYKSIIDNCAAVLTLYLSTLLGQSHFERVRQCRADRADASSKWPNSTTSSIAPIARCTCPQACAYSIRGLSHSSTCVGARPVRLTAQLEIEFY